MFIMKRISIFMFALLTLLIFGCISTNINEIELILENSGNNRKEINKAYNYFVEKGDSLQLNALLFLLNNSEQHNYTEIALFDSTDMEIPYSIYSYEDYNSGREGLDSLYEIHGDLNWKLKNRYNDLETITADLLIENIELAFTAWEKDPWSTSYSFSDFKECF